jgi:5-methylcytosine-specific restriction endonuclease McrA
MPIRPKGLKRMKQISTKQAQKNREVARIKKELQEEHGELCMICKSERSTDLMHILPKSIYPEHYTEKWNLALGCRSCHELFDSSAAYRRKTSFYAQVSKHDSHGAYRYFQMHNFTF